MLRRPNFCNHDHPKAERKGTFSAGCYKTASADTARSGCGELTAASTIATGSQCGATDRRRILRPATIACEAASSGIRMGAATSRSTTQETTAMGS